ncbi:LacI family DNA-binding transcriptional regulator [Planctomonas psychrotolerans]|uniref:LacI family DNA-binding transcriptional regulator n=1 Tax=Planctomonas psychrotolerans TaxID=2528712 RepID=UPI001238BB92|nr:LacI family DNA-binding transcriptional regulator [Planctomonas psychrotolerans]
MTARKPTIADVARSAGVSKGLVSFALNDRPGVSPETRSRILSVAEDLGWQPSLRARALSTRTAYALGLVIAREPDVIGVDPFFSAVIAGIERVLAPEGRVLVLSVVADPSEEIATYRNFARDSRVDGVFLTDLRYDDPRIPLLGELGIPAVTFGRPGCPSPFPAVVLDDTEGIESVVRHLIDLGHRRIAHVGGSAQLLHGARRRDAFLAATRAAGIPDAQVLETDFSAAAGAAAARVLLSQPEPPTAILFANDPMAIAGLSVAHERGVRVPEDLSISGFDGSDMSRYVYPTLTTVSSDAVAWGSAAAQTLLESIASGASSDVELPAARIVVRDSTSAARSDVAPRPPHPTGDGPLSPTPDPRTPTTRAAGGHR